MLSLRPGVPAARRVPVALFLLLVLALGVTGLPSLPAADRGAKVVVPAGESAAVATLEAGGARLVADRGAYRVYDVPAGQRATASALTGVVVRDDFDVIALRRAPLDTRAGDAGPVGPFAAETLPRRLMLVQFPAPPTDDELAKLTATGARLVHYVPQNAWIVWTPTAAEGDAVARLAGGEGSLLQHAGAYRVDHVISPALDERLASEEPVEVVVQVFNYGKTPDGSRTARADAETVVALATRALSAPREAVRGTYFNVRVAATGAQILDIARLDSVVNIEPRVAREKFDERQDLVMAGADNGSLPTLGDGYLAWLAGRGFPTTPASFPVVCVNDDGTGNGNVASGDPTLHETGNAANPTRLVHVSNATADAAGNGRAGHGHINISIVGGYDQRTGAPFVDAGGFRRGLGVAPHGRMSSVKVFTDAGSFDLSRIGGEDSDLIAFNYANGDRIATNSWGANVFGAYDTSAQDFDAGVRDADPTTAGNQEISYIFSAGNSGPGAGSIGSPGTAKNVLTVGASENTDNDGTDGCAVAAGEANDLRDVASFSSRGPTDDGRTKPDIIAPGTHIQGTASTDPNFDGSGVCDEFWPAGQTVFARSSGTSHSTPAVAGFAALAAEYLVRAHGFDLPGSGGDDEPSPALLKAFLLHAGRHLTGVGANDNFPSQSQGWGFTGGDLAFAPRAPRFFFDQALAMGAPGEQRSFLGTVPTATEPLRIVLAWTDAPGATTGNAYVNDLDLTVTVGGQTYRGNNFALGVSQPGGNPDFRNNVEAVFLPAGLSGAIAIQVTAVTIAGDGVPGDIFGDTTDQDFALVAYNFAETPTPFFEATGTNIVVDTAGNGNANGMADPGENTLDVTVEIRNAGTAPATSLLGAMTAISPTATVVSSASTFADLGIGASASSIQPFRIALSPDHPCGAPVLLRVEVSAAEGTNGVLVSLPTGVASPGTPLPVLDFESGAIPSGWTSSASAGTDQWAVRDVATSAATSTSSGSFLISFEPFATTSSNSRLVSQAVTIGPNAELSFYHTYASESGFDGGRIGLSTTGPAGPWIALDSRFLQGGYNSTFGGAAGWSGGSIGTMTRVRVDLGAWAGQTVHVGFETRTDGSVSPTASGWFIDDVTITDLAYTCAAPPVALRIASVVMDDSAPGNAVNGYLDPGETVNLAITLANDGTGAATGTIGTLTTDHPSTTISAGNSSYSIPGGGSGSNASPFTLALAGSTPCGDKIDLSLAVASDQGTFYLGHTLSVGNVAEQLLEPASTDVPKAIADNATATSTITIAETSPILDVDVLLTLTHTYCADLDIFLEAPDGTVVELSTDNGGSSDNFTGTIFDDEATTPVTGGAAPFTGSFRPETPLSVLDGKSPAGVWTLRISDDAGGDTGSLASWSLRIGTRSVSCEQLPEPPAVTTGLRVR